MATFTISLPKEYIKARKDFPEVNWNDVLKKGILRRLGELKQIEERKGGG